jgi:tetratricopeptide (TPR) repeat protein
LKLNFYLHFFILSTLRQVSSHRLRRLIPSLPEFPHANILASPLLLPVFTLSELVSKIDKNTKGVAMFDRSQLFLAGMSIALSIQLSQPVAAATPVGKVVQIAQTNSSNSDAAQKVYEEAEKLYEQGTAEALRNAIVKYEEALKLFRAVGDSKGQALSLLALGKVYSAVGKKQKALEYLGQSLPLFRAVSEAATKAVKEGLQLYQQGTAQAKRGAITKYEEALKLYRAIGEAEGEASTLYNIGSVYSDLGEQQKALEYYNHIMSGRLPLIKTPETTGTKGSSS